MQNIFIKAYISKIMKYKRFANGRTQWLYLLVGSTLFMIQIYNVFHITNLILHWSFGCLDRVKACTNFNRPLHNDSKGGKTLNLLKIMCEATCEG